MIRRISFANQEFYHVFNRGVVKQAIFLDDQDRARFVHDLYEMNDSHPTLDYRIYGRPTSVNRPARKLLVDIVAWCLMSNHFHLMVRQRLDDGISLFMKKLGTGYAKYFNNRHERSGYVFQGSFRAVHVSRDAQLLHLSRYIHLNPVDIIEPQWEEHGISDRAAAEQFLATYRWSSYQDWIGHKNFPSVLAADSVRKIFTTDQVYAKFVSSWTQDDHRNIAQLSEKL